MAGGILIVGTVMLMQLTRTTLESWNPNQQPGQPPRQAIVDTKVAEQLLRAQVANIKALRDAPAPVATIPPVPVGRAQLYIDQAANAPAPVTGGNGLDYTLREYELWVKMTDTTGVRTPATDSVLAHTRFLKLGVNGVERTGL